MANIESSSGSGDIVRLSTVYYPLGTLVTPRKPRDPELASQFVNTVTEMFHDATRPFDGGTHTGNPIRAHGLPAGMVAVHYQMMFTGRPGSPEIATSRTSLLANGARHRAHRLWGEPGNPGEYFQRFLNVAIERHPDLIRRRPTRDDDSGGNIIDLEHWRAIKKIGINNPKEDRTGRQVFDGLALWSLVGYLILKKPTGPPTLPPRPGKSQRTA